MFPWAANAKLYAGWVGIPKSHLWSCEDRVHVMQSIPSIFMHLKQLIAGQFCSPLVALRVGALLFIHQRLYYLFLSQGQLWSCCYSGWLVLKPKLRASGRSGSYLHETRVFLPLLLFVKVKSTAKYLCLECLRHALTWTWLAYIKCRAAAQCFCGDQLTL